MTFAQIAAWLKTEAGKKALERARAVAQEALVTVHTKETP
jgi:hypothetical protein